MADDQSLLIKINGNAKDFLDELDKIKKQTKDIEKVLSTTAKASAALFVGFSASIAQVTKSFADYETALVGVGKTTNIEGKKLEDFGKEFQKLAGDIPLAANELLGIAQAAGQLGVSGEKNLLKFTKTIAQLGVATDLSGEEAATQLTRILNVTGEGIDTIDQFGAAIVGLGNNFAATESEIVRMANEISRSTAVFKVSATEAAGLGAALRSVGIRAELGGSVVGKAFLTIQKAIAAGGSQAERLQKITGLTGDQLRKTFDKDATQVFQLFLDGLGKLEGGTSAVFTELEAFGLKGDEVNKVLPVLAKNSELVARALNQAKTDYKENTALVNEAEKAFSTLNSEGIKLQNEITRLAVDIGEELAPTVRDIVVGIREFVQSLNNNKDALAGNIATVLKWGAAISGIIATATAFALGVIKISGIIAALTAAFGPAALGASAFWAALTGPVGIAIAGLVAATAAVGALQRAAQEDAEPKTLIEINKELERLEKTKKRLADTPLQLGGDPQALKAIDEQIKKLEELKKTREEAGDLILRPDVVTKDPTGLGADLFGIQTQEHQIPFTPVLGGEEAVNKAKDTQKKITEVLDEETQKRVDKLKVENAQMLNLQQARGEAQTQEEMALLERRAAIENEFIAARAIRSQTERDLALQNLQLKHEQELQEITAQQEELALKQAEADQRRRDTREALREEDRELFDQWDIEDQERLAQKILTEDDIQREADERRFLQDIERRNQYLRTEKEFGDKIAKLDQLIASQKVQAAKDLSGQILAQARAAGQEGSSIARAAALTQIAINTPEAASSNYKYAARLGGPVAGAIAAGIAIAFGAEQAKQVLAANTGGIVPSLNGSRSGVDSVPALLTPNELVVPAQNFDEVIAATAEARGFVNPEDTGSAESSQLITIALEPQGDFINMIEQKLIEVNIQNTGVA